MRKKISNQTEEKYIFRYKELQADGSYTEKEKEVIPWIIEDLDCSKWHHQILYTISDWINPVNRRRNRFHIIFKKWLTYPLMKIVDLIIGPHIWKHDSKIKQDWWNNHIRIKRHCYLKALQDGWGIMVSNQIWHQLEQKKISYKEVVLNAMKRRSYKSRKFMCDLQATLELEDTFDREVNNFFILRLTREMMSFYGVNPSEINKIPKPGQYPVYLAKKPNDMTFFSKCILEPVWIPKEDEMLYNEEFIKIKQ